MIHRVSSKVNMIYHTLGGDAISVLRRIPVLYHHFCKAEKGQM